MTKPLTEDELEDLWDWADDDDGMHLLVRLAVSEVRAHRDDEADASSRTLIINTQDARIAKKLAAAARRAAERVGGVGAAALEALAEELGR